MTDRYTRPPMNGAARVSPPGAGSPVGLNPRQMTILGNLGRIYALSGRGLPNPQQEPEHAAALLSGWEIVLDKIPDAWLDRAFAAAMQAHRGPGLVQPGEVGDAWDGLLDERRAGLPADRQLPAGPGAPVCAVCGDQGWLIDRAHGTPGHRDLIRCACGHTGGASAPRGSEDYTIAALLVVLQEWCAEHRDGLALPVRLGYALACKAAGAPPYDLRRLLDSTAEPTLYRALTALGVPVAPPPALGTHDPRSLGAALEGQAI